MLHRSEDSFTLESQSLGALKHLKIRHNSSDSSCEWFVENIDVQELTTYTTYEFRASNGSPHPRAMVL